MPGTPCLAIEAMTLPRIFPLSTAFLLPVLVACGSAPGDDAASSSEAIKPCLLDDTCAAGGGKGGPVGEAPPPSHGGGGVGGGGGGGGGGGLGGIGGNPSVLDVQKTLWPNVADSFQIDGANFGGSPGQVRIYGNFLSTTSITLSVTSWSESTIQAYLGTDIGGFLEQDAQLTVLDVYGYESNKTQVHLVPNYATIDIDASAFTLQRCNSNANTTNTCGANGPASVGGHHLQAIPNGWCGPSDCTPSASGDDYYALPPLKNGWVYVGYHWTDPYGVYKRLENSGFTSGADAMVLDVAWGTHYAVVDATARHVAPTGDMHYSLSIQIEGPAGVPYR